MELVFIRNAWNKLLNISIKGKIQDFKVNYIKILEYIQSF